MEVIDVDSMHCARTSEPAKPVEPVRTIFMVGMVVWDRLWSCQVLIMDVREVALTVSKWALYLSHVVDMLK